MNMALNIEAVKLHEFHGVYLAVRLRRIAALEDCMRDFKRRCFIKPPDSHPTPVPVPEDIPEAGVSSPLPRTVRIRFRWRNAARWSQHRNAVLGMEFCALRKTP